MSKNNLFLTLVACGVLAQPLCAESWSTLHKSLQEDMRALREDMSEWIAQSRKEMQELFDALESNATSFADTYRSGVGVSFEETDGQLRVHVQLPEQAQVNTKNITAEMEDGAVVLHVPYDSGRLELEVHESEIELATKQEIEKDESKKDDSAQSQYTYTAQSQMMQTLPAHIVPSSVKKDGAIKVSYDEERNNMTLTFDKKQRPQKVRVETEKTSKAASDKTEKAAEEKAADTK